jgi:hypothetical protein
MKLYNRDLIWALTFSSMMALGCIGQDRPTTQDAGEKPTPNTSSGQYFMVEYNGTLHEVQPYDYDRRIAEGWKLASHDGILRALDRKARKCVELKRELGYSEEEIEKGSTSAPKLPECRWGLEEEERKRNPPLGLEINTACNGQL